MPMTREELINELRNISASDGDIVVSRSWLRQVYEKVQSSHEAELMEFVETVAIAPNGGMAECVNDRMALCEAARALLNKIKGE